MQKHLEEELEELNRDLYTIADMTLESLSKAVASLRSGDVALAKAVIRNDKQIDLMEKRIDNLCVKTLITQQPAAVDMRFILGVMKINTDVERIADLAATIARQTKKISGQKLVKPLVDIPRMHEACAAMLRKALQAIAEKNADLAYEILDDDSMLDELDDQIYRELYSYMLENPSVIAQSLALIKVSKSLERIGDHIKNIAETAIYYIKGDDIRHIKGSKLRKFRDED
jgi:phosphate transport system protein